MFNVLQLFLTKFCLKMGGTFRSRLLVCSNYVFVYYISEMSNADFQTCMPLPNRSQLPGLLVGAGVGIYKV